MRESIVTLPWLPDAPADFSAQSRALLAGGEDAGPAVQRLAGYRLNATQSNKVGQTMRKLRAAGCSLSPLSDFRLGVLANSTMDFAIDCMPAAAARHGVALELVTAPYDQVMQAALDPNSTINQTRVDAVLVAVDHRWLKLDRADFRM